jgi:hypothetical protein
MTKSANSNMQKLLDEVENMDPNDNSLEVKLNLIAQKVAEEQGKLKGMVRGVGGDDSKLVDPSDAFACEGCQ